MVKRANISLSDEIMNRVDERALEMGLNRSAFITVAVNNYFLQEEAMRIAQEIPVFCRNLKKLKSVLTVLKLNRRCCYAIKF